MYCAALSFNLFLFSIFICIYSSFHGTQQQQLTLDNKWILVVLFYYLFIYLFIYLFVCLFVQLSVIEGKSEEPSEEREVTSHFKPICAALYNDLFNQVCTGPQTAGPLPGERTSHQTIFYAGPFYVRFRVW